MKEKQKTTHKLDLRAPFPERKKQATKIHCVECNHEIPAADISLPDKLAKCGSCNTVFSFRDVVMPLLGKKKVRQELIRPEGIELFQFQDELDISIQQPITVGEILGISFFPFIAFATTIAHFIDGIPMAIPMAFWIGALYCIYVILFRSKHKIYLTIDRQNLTIAWRPNKLRKEIDQVYVKPQDGGHSVMMILNGKDGQKHVRLIRSIKGVSQAHYLEQEIERQLGIVNREVPEEG